MADFVKAGNISELTKGNMKTFVVKGKSIAIANVDGEYFAVDDICSHEHCSLGNEGFLEGSEIICGCHGSKFDVTTGKVLSLPATVDVGSYPVKVEGEDILVAI